VLEKSSIEDEVERAIRGGISATEALATDDEM